MTSAAPTPRPSRLVEYLSVGSWLLAVVGSLLRDRGAGTATVRYVDATRPGLALARATARFFSASVDEAEFAMFDVRNSDGTLVRMTLAYRDVLDVQHRIMETPDFREFVARLPEGTRVLDFVEKRIAAEGDFRNVTLWRAMYLAHVALYLDGGGGGRGDAAQIGSQPVGEGAKSAPSPIVFLARRVWGRQVAEYARGIGVDVAFVRFPWFDAKAGLLQWLGGWRQLVQFVMRQSRARGVGAALKAIGCMGGLCPRESAPTPAARIAADYQGQLNIDSPEMHSDLFFWQESDLAASDIVVLDNLLGDHLTAEQTARVGEVGMGFVALNPRSVADPTLPVYVPRPHLTVSAPSFGGRERRWLGAEARRYHGDVGYWRDLFAATDARVWFSWYKYGPTHCAIADAMRDLGGVTTLYQRAFEDAPSAEGTVSADVFFGFSQWQAGIESKSDSTIPYFVATGYPGDHRFALLKPLAENFRAQLHEAGAKHIVAFFDENSADDSRWHTGHGLVRTSYAAVLEHVLADPELGLILKPKVPASLARRLGPVAELLEAAEATGRCIQMTTGSTLLGAYPPAVAALAADVAIHGHLVAGTAAIEAALAGVPTLLMDSEYWPTSRFYDLGRDTVVFQDWGALWSALDEHWRTPGGVPGLGDWSALLPEFDPFRDGRAAERIGTYLQWLLGGIRAGQPRERVLEEAAQHYAAAWGADKVTCVSSAYARTPAEGAGGICSER